MKKIILISASFLIFGLCTRAQQVANLKASAANDSPAAAVLEMKEASYDFGKIPQGRPVTHNFQVTNKGKKPVLIENVQASCGCTTPEWSEQPVGPDATTMIKVGFNAASEGHFQKTITMTYNNGQIKTFTINGEVLPSPATSAPLNTSLSLIK